VSTRERMGGLITKFIAAHSNGGDTEFNCLQNWHSYKNIFRNYWFLRDPTERII